MSQQAQDDYYKDEVALALDYASAVNAEIKDLLRRAPTSCARPHRAKAVDLAPPTHGLRVRVEATLHRPEHMFVLPACDAAPCRRAPILIAQV